MQVKISGQHISLSQSLQEHVNNRATEVVTKYFENALTTSVRFSKQNNGYICELIVNEGSGRDIVLKSNTSKEKFTPDIYNAFDSALIKLESQLRKYKGKLNDRSNKIKVSEINTGTKYIISPANFDEMDIDSVESNDNASYETDNDNPKIIAEKPTEILTLSVKNAVMKMDLEDLPALMFKNINNGKLNIVYYRKDGNISWVDCN